MCSLLYNYYTTLYIMHTVHRKKKNDQNERFHEKEEKRMHVQSIELHDNMMELKTYSAEYSD
jgi:hypothetical protein